MAAPRQFRLGTLLSVTLHMPLSYEGDGPGALINHMIGNRGVHPLHVPHILNSCVMELLVQHPWLGGVRVPEWIAERQSWTALWAWLDTREIKHGVWHPVVPIADLRLPEEPTVTVLSMDEMPEELRETLKYLGFIEDDTPDE